MSNKLIITHAVTASDLENILALQSLNLATNIPEDVARHEGFVTIKHTIELLEVMNRPYPHVIAKDLEDVVGYALVMLPDLAPEIPFLKPMFDTFSSMNYNGLRIRKEDYFVMGQICVAKDYRSTGVFARMYDYLTTSMKAHFKYCITEISQSNQRSLAAHLKLGFTIIHEHIGEDGINWYTVLLDLTKQ